MYTQNEYEQSCRDLGKRWKIAIIPSAVLLAAAIAIFVIGQLRRNDSIWLVTVLLTFLAFGFFTFFYGVAVKPARIYRTHIGYMLSGPFHEYEGILKSYDSENATREGLFCHAVMMNVGEKDDPKDDRLVYWDSFKNFPQDALGKRVRIKSNNNMIADLQCID